MTFDSFCYRAGRMIGQKAGSARATTAYDTTIGEAVKRIARASRPWHDLVPDEVVDQIAQGEIEGRQPSRRRA